MPRETQPDKPLVSVVLAIFNEVAHVQKCVRSLLAQETSDFDLEILAIDGGSTDGTREYLDRIAAQHSQVRVLLNEKRRANFAFNIGIRESRGQYVCIFGSHTIYKKDYISVCLKELLAKGAAGCGGRVLTEPSSNNLEARLVAYGMAHPFGSSSKSFRTQPEGFADAVNYMILRKDALIEAGGYSEVLVRNQDNDLNQKLCANGHRLFCTWKTECIYHPKSTVRALFRYAYGNGFWNVISFRDNPASVGLHHFVPFFFLAGLFGSILLSIAGLLSLYPSLRLLALAFPALLALHLAAGTLAALQVSIKKKFPGALWLPLVFLGFHVGYGIGSLVAFVTRASVPKSSFSRTNQSTAALARESTREGSA